MFPIAILPRTIQSTRLLFPSRLSPTFTSAVFIPDIISITTSRFPSIGVRHNRTMSNSNTEDQKLPASSVIALNDYASFTNINASSLIKLCPRGAYTTARTYHRTTVFELDTHIQRTSDSVRLMLNSSSPPPSTTDTSNGSPTSSLYLTPYEPLLNVEKFRSLMVKSITTAIQYYQQQEIQENNPLTQEPNDHEFKITILVCWDTNVIPLIHTVNSLILTPPSNIEKYYTLPLSFPEKIDSPSVSSSDRIIATTSSTDMSSPPSFAILTHVTALPPRRSPPIKLRIQGAPRQNASAKDSEWVKQRTALEAAKPEDVEEIILVDDEGNILEGTQTNIFLLLSNNTLYTAPIGQVLGGTVRRLVMEICHRENILIIEEAVNISSFRPPVQHNEPTTVSQDDSHDNKPYIIGAFITSTSRLVLPVDEISWSSYLQAKGDKHTPPTTTSIETKDNSSSLSSSSTWVPLPLPDQVSTFIPHNPLIQRIETLVEQEIAKHSQPLVTV